MKPSFIIPLAISVLGITGCAFISNHSHSKMEGNPVGEETIARIQIGDTTKSWLISALGTPDSASGLENGELLKYSSRRITKRHGHLLFVIDSSSERIEKETCFFSSLGKASSTAIGERKYRNGREIVESLLAGDCLIRVPDLAG